MRPNEHDPDASDEDEQVSRVEIPPSPTFPPPPDIQISRPAKGLGAKPSSGPGASGSSYHGSADGNSQSNVAQAGALLSAGITFAASVIVGVLLGQWLDHKFNPSGTPWFTIVLTVAGVAAGFTNLFRLTAIQDTRNKK